MILLKSKSVEDSGVLTDGVTEIVKYEIKKREGRFLGALLAPLATSILQPVISSVVKDTSGEEFQELQEDIWMKNFSSASSFKQYRDY